MLVCRGRNHTKDQKYSADSWHMGIFQNALWVQDTLPNFRTQCFLGILAATFCAIQRRNDPHVSSWISSSYLFSFLSELNTQG